MDNESLRKDEVEALSAIYGQDLVMEDADSNVFSITLNHCSEPDKTIKLEIRFSQDYPLSGPPYYTLSAPWMSRQFKANLTSDLDSIYLQHSGESILYMWIEKAREYLDKDDKDDLGGGSGSGSGSGGQTTPDKDADENDAKLKLEALIGVNSGKSEENGDNQSQEEYEYKYEDYNYEKDNYHHHHHHHHRHHHNDNGISNDIMLYHGEPIVDRRSVFQAHLCPVDCIKQVNSALAALKSNKKIASATHNISAYRIAGGAHHSCIQDCDDDGETHAGGRLLHLLQLLDVKNVLVVVSRWYGGVNLGADRFKHINNAARELLSKCGYLEVQSEKQTSSTGKKKKSK